MSLQSWAGRLVAETRAVGRTLLQRDGVERDMDEEMRFHVDMQAEKNRRLGMSPADARRAAVLAFGGTERFQEEVRDARGGRALEDTGRDLRRSLRGLRRTPGYTAAIVASLALGLGSTTAIAALVSTVLLRPLPYPESDRLVAVGHSLPGYSIASSGQSSGTYHHYREHARSFEAFGAYWENDVSITEGDEPERIHVAMATPSVFAILGVPAALGRVFVEEDATKRHVLISHELWQNRFGADPQIIGRAIETNRTPDVVVGVMPPGFDFPVPGTKLWYAAELEAERADLRDLFMQGLGRLAPGVSAEAARQELERLAPMMSEVYADATRAALAESGLRPTVIPLKDEVVRDVRAGLVMLLYASGFVLLVAWANVATLALVRAERRQREVAIARALGAPASRVARLVLVEGALVALAGAVLGVGLAWLGTRLGFGLGAAQIPRLHELRMDGTTASVAGALTIGSVLVIAAASLLRGIRTRDVGGALRGRSARISASREGQRVQRGLVALQTALALTLLIAAASMGRSLVQLRQAELGFVPEQLLAFELNPPARYLRYAAAVGLHAQILDGIRREPGVQGAELVMRAPLMADIEYLRESLEVEGGASVERHAPSAVNFATPGYFRLMGVPLLQGRTFQAGDLLGDAPPIIMSASLARSLFGDRPAVGERVRLTGKPRYPAYEIVGVVGDVPGAQVADGPAPTFYFPVLDDLRHEADAQLPIPYIPREATIVVRTAVPPLTIVPAARRVMREVDAKIPLSNPRSMVQSVAASTARLRLTALLLLFAAGTTLFLGVVGLYGVVAYTVSLRRSEFGVRLALGASPAAVRRMVVRQGAAVAAIGIAVGLLVAAATMRLLRGLLYQVDATDPLLFAAMAALLLAIGLVASWIPARRAGATDPALVLRAE